EPQDDEDAGGVARPPERGGEPAAGGPDQLGPHERPEDEQPVVTGQATDEQQDEADGGEREGGPVADGGGQHAECRPGRGEPAGGPRGVEGAEPVDQAGGGGMGHAGQDIAPGAWPRRSYAKWRSTASAPTSGA